jgi:hypothetical protein
MDVVYVFFRWKHRGKEAAIRGSRLRVVGFEPGEVVQIVKRALQDEARRYQENMRAIRRAKRLLAQAKQAAAAEEKG